MRGVQAAFSLLSLSVAILAIGCGYQTTAATCSSDPLTTSSSGANFSLVPQNSDFTIYPGGTVQLPLLVQPVGTATGSVTITPLSLPQGITIDSAAVAIGSTAMLNVHATLDATSNCFAGVRDVFSAGRSVTLSAQSSAGTYTASLPITVVLEDPAFLPAATSLPIFNITTVNSAPVDSEDDYVDATLNVVDHTNKSNDYTGTMGIKGHGNSTWEMPKKPYRLNLDKKASLIGFTSDTNWILLANYDDKSMLRTDLANHISTLAGMLWTPGTAFVELYLNGQYEGVYQLSEKIEVSKARLNIGSIDDTDNSGTDLTGGYLAEISVYPTDDYTLTSPSGLPIALEDPDTPTPEQALYYIQNFGLAETSLLSSTFTDPQVGWRSHWDQDSLVQWFIVNELMGNVDANDHDSDYFYKPRGDDNFYMGPVWDFDVTAGNVNYAPIVSPTVPWVSTQSRWYTQLFKDPTFVAAVKAKWTQLRPQIGELPAYLDTRATALTPAAQNNYTRWTTISEEVWPNSESAGSYAGEVAFLKTWITQRTAYMDANYLQK